MKALWSLVEDRKSAFVICALLAALGSILLIVPFALIFQIVRYMLESGELVSLDPILVWLGWAFAALCLRYVLMTSSFVFAHIAAFDLLYGIRRRLVIHVGTLPMGFWSRRNAGQMQKIIQEDVEAIEGFVAHHLPDIAAGFTLPIMTLGYLYYLDWRLAIAATIPLPLTLLFLYMLITGKMTGQSREALLSDYHKAMERMHATMIEYVEGMPVVKSFRLGTNSFEKLRDTVLTYREIILTWTRGISPYRAIVSTIVMGGGMFILPLSVYLLQKGSVDATTIILFLLLGTGCFQGLLKAIQITIRTQMITAGVKRINGVLSATPLSEPAIPQSPSRYDIAFRDVSFAYEKEGPSILANIDFDLPQGSFTALIGPSGAGKTTIVNLITRMWDPVSGEIRIGDQSLQEIGSKGLSNIVGTVFQDIQLLSDSVEANIRMGNVAASFDEVITAAKAASCHDLITSFADGYATQIGDGGAVHLSGGEKQRVAIARVFLKNPPIILLDEATSYADAESETLIQEAFARLMPGKTVIVVAHRLSTIAGADKIIAFDQGHIVESGSHPELIEADGLYRRMWDAHSDAGDWSMTVKKEQI